MKKRIILSALVSVGLLSGCTSIPSLDSSSPDYLKSMSFAPVPDKATLYVYRTKLSDFQGMVTTVDIGEVELEIFPNCVHRFELASGSYDFEPNGIGTFSIEEEISIDMAKGSVNFVELHHTSKYSLKSYPVF